MSKKCNHSFDEVCLFMEIEEPCPICREQNLKQLCGMMVRWMKENGFIHEGCKCTDCKNTKNLFTRFEELRGEEMSEQNDCVVGYRKHGENWPDPTPEELELPEFNAIWNVIKTWDINVPEVDGQGMYTTASGNHVVAILRALQELEK